MGEMARPQEGNIDAWGLTHPGKVRADNQDHFFLGALGRGVRVNRTSIGAKARRVLHAERLATLAMVADGVGGRSGGEEAARLALQELVSSVSRSFHDADYAEENDPEVFSRVLHEAALECHESLLKKAEHAGAGRGLCHDAHAIPWSVAARIPAAAGRFALLHLPGRGADPDQQRPNVGPGPRRRWHAHPDGGLGQQMGERAVERHGR